MEKKIKPIVVFGISKDIQYKGMKHIDARTEAQKEAKVAPYYNLMNKATGNLVEEFVK